MPLFNNILRLAYLKKRIAIQDRKIKELEAAMGDSPVAELAEIKRSLVDLGASYETLKRSLSSSSAESRFQQIEKLIADSQSEMIREARAWKEIAYAVAKPEDIKKEVFRRDAAGLKETVKQ